MISVGTKGIEIIITVTLPVKTQKNLAHFIYGVNTEARAEIIAERIDKMLRDAIEKERREHYELGYSHGRGHRGKNGCFSRCL